MSDPRIPLAKLRRRAVRSPYGGPLQMSPEAVLALVEAVEAAQAYLAVPRKAVRDEATGAIIADFRPQQKAQQVLAAALARFDFGGERP